MNGSHNMKSTKARCATTAGGGRHTEEASYASQRPEEVLGLRWQPRPQAGAQRLDAIGRPSVPENFTS